MVSNRNSIVCVKRLADVSHFVCTKGKLNMENLESYTCTDKSGFTQLMFLICDRI